MWTHLTKFKGKAFFGNYEYSKSEKKQVFKLKNAKTGTELKKEYGNCNKAKADGWKYTKG